MTGSMPQVLSFSAIYRRDVLAGSKTSTVRWGEDLSIGPVSIVFDDDPSAAHPARILTITRRRSDAVSPTDVGAPDETDMREFVEQLRANHYAAMPAVATLTVVTFALDDARSPDGHPPG